MIPEISGNYTHVTFTKKDILSILEKLSEKDKDKLCSYVHEYAQQYREEALDMEQALRTKSGVLMQSLICLTKFLDYNEYKEVKDKKNRQSQYYKVDE